ncbi:coiled coils domain protein [Pacmanvirus S19]|nr:coiled coils domain protein [Pacmanvirus S19]
MDKLNETIQKLNEKVENELLDYEFKVTYMQKRLDDKLKKLAGLRELFDSVKEMINEPPGVYSVYFKFGIDEKYPTSSGKYFIRRFIRDKTFRRKYMTLEMINDAIDDFNICGYEIRNIEDLAYWCYDNFVAHNYSGDSILDEIEDEFVINRTFNKMVGAV